MSDDSFDDKTVIAQVGPIELDKPETQDTIATLVQYSGEALGKRHHLEKPTLRLGRSADADVVVPETSVSRLHAFIHQNASMVEIEDAGSANGTFVNDKKLPQGLRWRLKDQDMIRLGTVVLKFFAHDNLDGMIQDKIYRMATIDAGTQIYNKQYLLDSLAAEFNLARRTGRFFSLIYFDLDHFKKVNDNYGHNAGDQVLRECADLVKTLIRKDDVFARFGGEEFVVVLPGTDLQTAAELGERIRKACADKELRLNVQNDSGQQIVTHHQTISVGIAELTPDIPSPKELLEVADKKLYTSKETGRNRVTY